MFQPEFLHGYLPKKRRNCAVKIAKTTTGLACGRFCYACQFLSKLPKKIQNNFCGYRGRRFTVLLKKRLSIRFNSAHRFWLFQPWQISFHRAYHGPADRPTKE